jgi:3-deoxy-D-manno-octulosonic-acid transferase
VTLPPVLSVYRLLTGLAAPLFPYLLNRRAKGGKEDPARKHERLGKPTELRPEGTLIWLHGASVGESLVLATLVEHLGGLHADWNFLVTTGTTTSAELMANRLASNARHQYVPIDTPGAARGFLDHWKPDLAIFAESEIWPNLLLETSERGIPMALVNARMNDKSLRSWRTRRATANHLFGAFNWIGAADQRTHDGLTKLLDQPIALAGNLKLEAGAQPPDTHALMTAHVNVSGRLVWLAASTHEGEEETVLKAHDILLEAHPDCLLILAPRHPERGKAIARMVRAHGYGCAQRSKNEIPHTNDRVWLADTLGEMPLWFTVAPAALIAGSLKPGIGGHNPIEASQAGSTVITGPYFPSFQDLYDSFRANDAAIIVKDATELAAAVETVWDHRGPTPDDAARAIAQSSGGALQTTIDAVIALLPDPNDNTASDLAEITS